MNRDRTWGETAVNFDRNAHPTEKQRKYLADLLGINLKDLINPPRTRGEMSDLIGRMEANRYSVALRKEIKGLVAPEPQVEGVLAGLRENNIHITRTQKQLRTKVDAKSRAAVAARYGIVNASADPIDWPFWALLAGCAEWKIEPRMGRDYPYLGVTLGQAVADAKAPAPPMFVREAGVFYTETRLEGAGQGSDGKGAAGEAEGAQAAGVSLAQLRKLVEEQVAARVAEIEAANRITVAIGGVVRAIAGVKHKLFERVLQLAARRKPVLLIGPTGCGKSHLVGQAAEALGLPFYSINCTMGMSESKLLGLLLPNGDYIPTDFVRAYEEGGVFLMDEIDAADPNVLLIMNTALAQGVLPLPTRREAPVARRHPDFILVAAANTHGTGANRLFVGRNQLDDATLDRFRVGQIEMDYDRDLEARLVENRDLLETVWRVRDRVADAKVRRSVSTRFAIDAADMMAAGWTKEQVLASLTSGWSADERTKAGL